jgi:iron(III) transport system substrate-binding protein
VFWNNEVMHTIRLKQDGVTQPYQPAGWDDIPNEFKDADAHWTGLAARARVLLVNTNEVAAGEEPQSVQALADPAWRGRGTMAVPLTGTTATHVAVLWAKHGPESTQKLLEDIKANDTTFVASNGQVRDRVQVGDFAFGLTDTDDAYGSLARDMPVKIVYPDQTEDRPGTLVIPNTVSMIKGAPNADAARKLMDFLVSKRAQKMLAEGGGHQIPLRPGVELAAEYKGLEDIKALPVDWEAAAAAWTDARDWVSDNVRMNR